MDKEPGYAGRTYILKLGTMTVNAEITEIKNKINIETLKEFLPKKLKLTTLVQ